MKPLTAAEKNATKDAFAVIDDRQFELVDRTPLERYAKCPRFARFIETGVVRDESFEANSGIAVHEAISATIQEYVDSRGSLNLNELVDLLDGHIRHSRPDVQPDAIDGLRRSIWPIAKHISSIAPPNILRFDGGEGNRSGQLAHDFEGFMVRATSEIDLLHAGPSVKQLHEHDWKSGRKVYRAADVRNSFQFQEHAMLVFENYPEVESLEVTAWNTRINTRSWTVDFNRSELPALRARIRSAISERHLHKAKAPEDTPAWPDIDKCGKCPAALCCQSRTGVQVAYATNPVLALDELVSVEARADALRGLLDAAVKASGAEIVSSGGFAYGFKKPRESKPKCSLYPLKQAKESEEPDGPSA